MEENVNCKKRERGAGGDQIETNDDSAFFLDNQHKITNNNIIIIIIALVGTENIYFLKPIWSLTPVCWCSAKFNAKFCAANFEPLKNTMASGLTSFSKNLPQKMLFTKHLQ